MRIQYKNDEYELTTELCNCGHYMWHRVFPVLAAYHYFYICAWCKKSNVKIQYNNVQDSICKFFLLEEYKTANDDTQANIQAKLLGSKEKI
jgi:hypothetical protein